MCSHGCHLTSLGTSPDLWRCPLILAPVIDISPSATGSLWCSWPHLPVSWMLEILCPPGLCARFCAVARAVSYRIWCPPSVWCVFAYAPILGLWNTCMIAYRRKRFLQSASWWLCSGVIIVSCKYGTPAWLGWPSGDLWGFHSSVSL